MQFRPFAFRIFDRYAPVFDPGTLLLGASMALTAAGAGVTAMGTMAAGEAAADAGRRGQQASDFRAKQADMQAQESRAASQRVALEKRKEAGLLGSRLQARAAASGGGADDPTVIDLGGDIAQRGEYLALTEMFKGENRARGLEDQALGARMTGEALAEEGRAKRRAAGYSAAGTIIGAAGSMARFGAGSGLGGSAAKYGDPWAQDGWGT